MSRFDHIVDEMAETVTKHGGDALCGRFLQGSDAVRLAKDTAAASAFCGWLRRAIGVLDSDADAVTRSAIMTALGRACAAQHQDSVDALVSRRRRYPSLAAFIDAEANMVRDGEDVIVTYRPGSTAPGLRCYCDFWNPLSPGDQVSRTWCGCGAGHQRAIWEALVGYSVSVSAEASCLSGNDSCRFRVGGLRELAEPGAAP